MSNKYILKRDGFLMEKNLQSSDIDHKGFYFHKF